MVCCVSRAKQRTTYQSATHVPRGTFAGDKYPAFILSEYYEVEVDSSTNPLRKLRSAGKVWPLDVEADLSGKGTPNAFARTYSVDTREFTVESVLPPELPAAWQATGRLRLGTRSRNPRTRSRRGVRQVHSLEDHERRDPLSFLSSRKHPDSNSNSRSCPFFVLFLFGSAMANVRCSSKHRDVSGEVGKPEFPGTLKKTVFPGRKQCRTHRPSAQQYLSPAT